MKNRTAKVTQGIVTMAVFLLETNIFADKKVD